MIQRALFWLLMTVTGIADSPARAQDCALKVNVDKTNPAAYQAWGNRCEGTFGRSMAASINLRIVGFHFGYPHFDLRNDAAVRLTVSNYQPARKTLLRVISTRPKTYFQMDTSSLGNDGTFTWRLNVMQLLEQPLKPFEIAALACIATCQRNGATLLPVRVSGAADDKPPMTLTLLVMAEVELTSLKATLRQGTRVVYENRPVGGRYLSPDTPIPIPMDEIEAGEFALSLAALTRSGQQDFIEAVLLIPPRGK